MAMPERPAPRRSLRADIGALPVLDASPNAVVGVDAGGQIVYANPQVSATFGWEPDELVGRAVETLIPSRFAGQHAGHRATFAGRPSARPMGIGLDLAGERRDGSEFPVEISLAPVHTPDGVVTFATIVDITARKRLEGQLLQAQKMESVGRLAGGIAHDFNNMIFAIRGYADLLIDDLDAVPVAAALDADELRRNVQAIAAAADRAGVLTAQLLAFSRRQVIHPVVVDLRAAVVAVEPLLRRVIGEQVRLALALHPETGTLRSDPGQLDQVLMNLVVNARDAMPGGGTITIETGNVVFDEPYAVEHFQVTPGPYVMLAVSDTGNGIDRETRRHIFEPFFTTKEPGKGTGLGLSTTYGIVQQAGGHIWVYSEPGRGTTFKLYLPRVDAPDVQPAAPSPAAGRGAAGTILLLEDEPAVRDLSRQVLERAGYAVMAPDDPRHGLVILEDGSTRVDALVTDAVMPDISGPELARRALAAREGLAIVILSGYSSETDEIAALVAQGATFASKPMAARTLVRLVREAISAAQTARR